MSNPACLTVACGSDGMMTGSIRPDVFGSDSSVGIKLNSGTCTDKIEFKEDAFQLSTGLTACEGTIKEETIGEEEYLLY